MLPARGTRDYGDDDFGGACALGLKALHLPVWAEASLTEAQVNDPINLSRTVSPKLIPLIKCAVIFRMVVVFRAPLGAPSR